jgi:hypothetical protein
MYSAKVMAKFDNAPFTRKEIKDLEKNPVVISEENHVSCPCGKFSGTVKELADDNCELKCPVCGNFNILRGMLYLRIFNKD